MLFSGTGYYSSCHIVPQKYKILKMSTLSNFIAFYYFFVKIRA
jgi:hypothetical protein